MLMSRQQQVVTQVFQTDRSEAKEEDEGAQFVQTWCVKAASFTFTSIDSINPELAAQIGC